MGRLKNTIDEIKLNKEIGRWRKIESAKIKRKAEQRIISNYSLNKSEKNSIDCFFKKNTKRKINYFWHLKYKIVSGFFHYDYFPEIYYNADLKHRLNNKEYTKVYSNKYVLSKIINGSHLGVLVPRNIISCNNGVILDSNDLVIDKNLASLILSNKDKMFCKKSVGTYGGDECTIINGKNKKDISHVLNNYGDNYLIQEIINNQADIKALNPSTLNTFRIITFFANNKFQTSPIILRIGRSHSFLDNAHAGGMFVGVDDDGTIISDAKDVLGHTFKMHPDSNIVFKGYHINNVRILKEKAIELAGLFPQTKLIDWDLTIDEKGNIVCIEANIDTGSIWLMQMTHGTPVFGIYTSEMFNYVHKDNIFKIIKNNIKR